MSYLKTLYGKTILNDMDSDELTKDNEIELEYYQIKNKAKNKPYGVEIVKRNMKNDILSTEEKIVNNICNKENENIRVLELLLNNKVTPISVDDILEDLLKERVI